MGEENAMEKAMEQAIGASVYGIVTLLVKAGLSPTDSMRLAGFFVIENALGREAIRALGLPRTTTNRWRREIAAAAESVEARALVGDPDSELDFINGVLPVLGLGDLQVVRLRDLRMESSDPNAVKS